MPSPELRVPVDVIRREVELACAATSFRVVAEAAGMSAMGVRSFVLGEGTPQKRTLRKLNAWYVHRAASRRAEGGEQACSALIVLAGFYPQADRGRVMHCLLDDMEREFRRSGIDPPLWLDGLRNELRGTHGRSGGRG